MKSGNAVWIERRSVRKRRVNKLIAASNLARGESEAIVLCQELNADLLIVAAAQEIAFPDREM